MKLSRQSAAIIVLAALWVATAGWGIGQLQSRRQADVLLQNKYNRAFYETLQRTKNVEALLSKGLVSGSPDQMDAILSDLLYNANSAQENLSQLPVSHEVVAKTSKFLSQVGDYSYSLVKQNKTRNLSDQDWQAMQHLYRTATVLDREMSVVEQSAAAGTFHWTEVQGGLNRQLPRETASSADYSFRQLDTKLSELPVLVYDGPFSDHIDQIAPQGLTGSPVTVDQARGIAQRFTDLGAAPVQQVVAAAEVSGKIPSYSFEFHTGSQSAYVITTDVSKQGGHVVLMLNSRPIATAGLSDAQALVKAQEFLVSRSLYGLVPTYTLREQNAMTVSFVYKQGNVIVYPDQVKVQIALDNGQVVGYEALGFLTSHHQRTIPEPRLTMQEARSRLSPRIQVLSERLALIPTANKGEVLTYEFKTRLASDNFLVYINAQNGEEENILKLLNLPNGTLTL